MEIQVFKRGGKVKKRTFERAIVKATSMPQQMKRAKVRIDAGLSDKGEYIKETRAGKVPTLKQRISFKPTITISVGAGSKGKKYAGANVRRTTNNDILLRYIMGEQKLKEQDKTLEGLKSSYSKSKEEMNKQINDLTIKQAELMKQISEAENPTKYRTGDGYKTEGEINGKEPTYDPSTITKTTDIEGLSNRLDGVENALQTLKERQQKIKEKVEPLLERGQTKITEYMNPSFSAIEEEDIQEDIEEETAETAEEGPAPIKKEEDKPEKKIKIIQQVKGKETTSTEEIKKSEEKKIEKSKETQKTPVDKIGRAHV